MNLCLVAAPVLSFITFGVHVFAGGPAIAAPLLRSRDLNDPFGLSMYFVESWIG